MNPLLYPLFSGKNSKLRYFVSRTAGELLLPDILFRRRREALLAEIDRRPDRDEIHARADYCNRLRAPAPLGPDAPRLADFRVGRKGQVYYFDAREVTRYFPGDLRWRFLPGDITYVPAEPSVVKSRPVAGDNANSVLLNLNKVRHFTFVRDRVPFRAKADAAVFRGKVCSKPKRLRLFEALFGQPGFDLGDTSGRAGVPPEWRTRKMTIREQLGCKFVLAIEGNDVASGLRWILSPNSLAGVPSPEFETWFLEGTLVPDVHYVEIAPDFSDAAEKTRWYAAHPDAAQRILDAAHAHVARFLDPRRELLVALLVMQRYFECTQVPGTGGAAPTL